MIALPARAKLNLDLRVVRKLPDGFHELETTMQAIDLHDLIQIEKAPRTELELTGLDIAAGDENIVLKAQSALEAAAREKLPARIHLHKRIPPGSGMGGASSDAATTLRALQLLYRLDIDLHAPAEKIGADVPFFLSGGRAIARGRGELLIPIPVADEWFAIAWPGIELSTAAVYRAWDEVNGSDLMPAAAHVDHRIADFAWHLGTGWQMTGSGSAFFKRCSGEQDARKTIATLETWTAVARAIGPWT